MGIYGEAEFHGKDIDFTLEGICQRLCRQPFSEEESIVGLRAACSPELQSCEVSVKGDHMKTGRGTAVITQLFPWGTLYALPKWSQLHFRHMAAGAKEGKWAYENGLMHLSQEIRC